jgi:hypothetical protein
MNTGMSDERNKNCASAFPEPALILILFLVSKIERPIIIVRLAMFEPKTLPIEIPPSPIKEAIPETNNSGKDVVTESKMKPAEI